MPQDKILTQTAGAEQSLANLKQTNLTVKELFEKIAAGNVTLTWNLHDILQYQIGRADNLAAVDANLVAAQVMHGLFGVDMSTNVIYQNLLTQFQQANKPQEPAAIPQA